MDSPKSTYQDFFNENSSSPEFLKKIIDSAPIGMLILRKDGDILFINAKMEALFGYTAEELVGQKVEILVPERFREGHPRHRDSFFENQSSRWMGEGKDLFGRRKDGSEFFVEIGLNPIGVAGGTNVVASVVDVTERKMIEQQLRRYSEGLDASLKRAHKDIEEFLYVASHDLRSPLNGIRCLAEWISEDNDGVLQEESVKHLAQMTSRIDQMNKLIDDLLEYSRAGRSRGKASEVDTGKLVQDTFGMLAPPQGFTLETMGLPVFWTSGVPLGQVLRNLLDNAIKHHDKPVGRICVNCKELGDFYEFSVEDDGSGIPAAFFGKMFKMFQSLQRGGDGKAKGTGMGLALIQRIVEGVGGKVRVESEEGKGSAFRFTWPKEFPTAPPETRPPFKLS